MEDRSWPDQEAEIKDPPEAGCRAKGQRRIACGRRAMSKRTDGRGFPVREAEAGGSDSLREWQKPSRPAPRFGRRAAPAVGDSISPAPKPMTTIWRRWTRSSYSVRLTKRHW